MSCPRSLVGLRVFSGFGAYVAGKLQRCRRGCVKLLLLVGSNDRFPLVVTYRAKVPTSDNRDCDGDSRLASMKPVDTLWPAHRSFSR